MKVVVTGATGFVGAPLVAALRARGDEVTALSRDATRARQVLGEITAVTADLETRGPWTSSLAGSDAIIHLAGERLDSKRWDARHKQVIRDSRVETTRTIVEEVAALGHRPGRPLGAHHDAVEVDGDDALEVTQVILHQAPERPRDPGVVDHHVQPAELLLGPVDGRLHAVGVGHVGVDRRRRAAQRRRCLGGSGLVDVGDEDTGALLDEDLGDGPADAPGTAGDDGDLALELVAHRR